MPGAQVALHPGTLELHRRAVDEDVADADRLVGGEPLGVGREVANPAHRAGADGLRIEHDHVGPGARAEVAAIGKAEEVGLDARELADGLSRSA